MANILGLNFNKISSFRDRPVKSASIKTQVNFTNLKEENNLQMKDQKAVSYSATLLIGYFEKKETDQKNKNPQGKKLAELEFKADILLSLSEEEAKKLEALWKKKEVPEYLRFPLYNLILSRCASRALQLEEELSLPPHFPLPQIRPEPKQPVPTSNKQNPSINQNPHNKNTQGKKQTSSAL